MISANRAKMAIGWRGENLVTHARKGNPFVKPLAWLLLNVLGFRF